MSTELIEQTHRELSSVENSAFNDIKTFESYQRIAKALCTSDLVPKHFRENMGNTMIAMEMANRIGANVLAVMQNLHVIHGKPSWSAQFIISAINSCGRFSPLRFVHGEDSCYCWAYDNRDNEKLVGPTVTIEMAKNEGWLNKNGSKWKTMPELMLMYRSASFFGRLYAPDILMGMQSSEEVIDVYKSEREISGTVRSVSNINKNLASI